MSRHKDDFETRQRFSADDLTAKVTLVLFPTDEQLKFGSFAGFSRIHLTVTHKIPTTPILSTKLHVTSAAESWFGPRWNNFFWPSVQAGRLKTFTLNRKVWLSFAEWLGLGLKGLICKSTNNDTTEKDKNICNVIGPGAPFRMAGSRYPLPPPPPTSRRHFTAP
jgi:hypothetical protein